MNKVLAFLLTWDAAVEHLRQLVESKTRLKEKARELQLMLGEV